MSYLTRSRSHCRNGMRSPHPSFSWPTERQRRLQLSQMHADKQFAIKNLVKLAKRRPPVSTAREEYPGETSAELLMRSRYTDMDDPRASIDSLIEAL